MPGILTPIFTPQNTHPYYTGGILNSASCSNNTCIAGGSYVDTDKRTRPFLAVSMDKGLTWKYPESIANVDFTPENKTYPYAGLAKFNSVSCSNALCVGVGSYDPSNQQILRPLLALSRDAGLTWSYPGSIPDVKFTPDNPNPPTNNYSMVLQSVSCHDKTCVAVGHYPAKNGARPLVVTSRDAGKTWIYPTSPTASRGLLNGVSCTASFCVAVGYYTDTKDQDRPLLGVSQDGGLTWKYSDQVAKPVFVPNNSHPFSSDPALRSVSCSGKYCLVAGSYRDKKQVVRPWVIFSKDSGKSWIYPDAVTAPVFSKRFREGQLLSANCNTGACTASGFYEDSTDTMRPLVVLNKDGGKTWTFPTKITEPVFTPTNSFPFSKGILSSGANTN